MENKLSQPRPKSTNGLGVDGVVNDLDLIVSPIRAEVGEYDRDVPCSLSIFCFGRNIKQEELDIHKAQIPFWQIGLGMI